MPARDAELVPTFGRYVRAARLGWYRAEQQRAWVRISDHGQDRWLVELAPFDEIPPGHGAPGGKYRVLGRTSGDADVRLINSIHVMAMIRSVKRPVQFQVDEEGFVR